MEHWHDHKLGNVLAFKDGGDEVSAVFSGRLSPLDDVYQAPVQYERT